MSDTKDLHSEAAKLAKTAGHRYTAGRQQIVEALGRLSRPVTIEEILSTDSGLAQSSVYRNIDALREAGIVKAIALGSEITRYELSDALSHHHHHMICTNCNSITGFELSETLEKALNRELHEATADSGFNAKSHVFDVHGVCSACVGP